MDWCTDTIIQESKGTIILLPRHQNSVALPDPDPDPDPDWDPDPGPYPHSHPDFDSDPDLSPV